MKDDPTLCIEYLPVDGLKPYDRNARVHDAEDVEALKQSILDYGFSDPIGVWGPENLIVEGHGRLKAAKALGMKQVPVIHLDHMTEEQQKAYRLVHNRTAELSFWDNRLKKRELGTITSLNLDVFRFSLEEDSRKAWTHVQKCCNLKKDIRTYKAGGGMVTTFFKVGKTGLEIEKIKESREAAANIAVILAEQLTDTFGHCLYGNDEWAMVTTPRRRHKKEYHFATDICEQAVESLKIPFYPDVVTARTRDRVKPDFTVKKDPSERNLILFDDIITTGQTLRATRDCFLSFGHIVYCLVAIKN